MNSTTIEEQNGKGGSIAVYQRLLPGRRPAKVEVIRATYETIRASNGKTFGRTNNTVLLRIPSGTTLLSSKDYTKLREVGLNEKQIVYVNGRLNSLAGPAQARTHEMDIVDAQAKLTSFASLLELTPSLAKDLRAVLVGALRDIDERIEVDGGPAGSGEESPTELLKNTLALLNQTCVRAQALYKQLPKGELPYDVVLEFQRSWFLHADMVSTFRNRKCFSRPAGWTGLRTQVLDGRIYKCGEPGLRRAAVIGFGRCADFIVKSTPKFAREICVRGAASGILQSSSQSSGQYCIGRLSVRETCCRPRNPGSARP